jgi:flagellar biosynthesis/type III secretory pathway M-ring protein FliF/YscJ
MNVGFHLAQLQDLNPFKSSGPTQRNTELVFQSILPIIGAGLALGLILLLWVKIAMRRGRRRRHHHHHHEEPSANPIVPVLPDDEDEDEKAGGRSQRRRRRKRRRRREHRPRNPTLAETGGLPSAKSGPTSNPPL